MSGRNALEEFHHEATRLIASETTTEATFYPAIKHLLTCALLERSLPFEVRTNTSESGDQPDLAFYDGQGDYLVLAGEAKLPDADLIDLCQSEANKNQIGRYLAQTRAAVVTNVRGFALVTVDPSWRQKGPVPSNARRIEVVVELWASASAMRRADPIDPRLWDRLCDLVETAVTRFAPIAEPESLARILARLARKAKADLPAAFSSAVKPLLDDFGTSLGIAFTDEEGEEFFRSSLVQTAFYALFSGYVLWHYEGEKKPFAWEDLGEYLRIPFLKQLFYEFRHPARISELRLAPSLDIASEALKRVNRDAFFKRFEGDEADSRPIVYFYEPFLEAFDPELRKELGVWYTPPEVVRYQVQKIDQILRNDLKCDRGFADDRVVVLDPCCGTGAYLLEVLRVIAAQLRAEGETDLLAARLASAFSTRIIGFEILTAPFVIAQLQLYLAIAKLGGSESTRFAVYLTNALTGWLHPKQIALSFPELQEEHDRSQKVKDEAKIIVVLGNPPYNRFAGAPVDEELELADVYKGIKRDDKGKQLGPSALYKRWGIRKHLLDDLYIRFFRVADRQIGERAAFGVVSFISNYSFLSGRSHPILRESLLHHFNVAWIDSLNGDKYRTGKVIPKGLPGAGTPDQSIFTTEYDSRGIQVGTCITTLVKEKPHTSGVATVWRREFWGRAADKRKALLASLNLDTLSPDEKAATALRPEGPRAYEEANPTEKTAWRLFPDNITGGYESWPGIDEIFTVPLQGVNPNRGTTGSLIDIDKKSLASRMSDYFDASITFEEIARRYPTLCEKRAEYSPAEVRETLLKKTTFREEQIVKYLLFPFDLRWIYYESEAPLLNRRRQNLWDALKDNEFLITVPQARKTSEALPLFATTLFDLHLHDRGSVAFAAERAAPGQLFAQRTSNIEPKLEKRVIASLGTKRSSTQLAHDMLRVILAISYAPAYGSDHRDQFSQDWARVPLPCELAVWTAAVDHGDLLAQLLDPAQSADMALTKLLGTDRSELASVESTDGKKIATKELAVTVSYFGSAKGKWVERNPTPTEHLAMRLGATTGDLYINDRVRFCNIPRRVWFFELGGYPVLKKWLGSREAKQRSGQPLTLKEVDWFRQIVQRITAILILREELNPIYERAAEASIDIS